MTRLSRRGPWLPEEDAALVDLVRTQGPNNWVRISQQLQHRSPKQCRERYHQNLKPSLNHEPISAQEGELIEQLVHEMGKRWAEIARRLGNRSDNAVKNWWNGSMNRRKRISTQNHHLKHVTNRIHPVSQIRPQRSHHELPEGITTAHSSSHSTTQPSEKRWSMPEPPVSSHRTLQPPILQLQSASESDLLRSRFAQPSHSNVPYPQNHTPKSSRDHALDYSRLAPLRLPSLSSCAFDNGHGPMIEKPSISPAISDFLQSLLPKTPPSLVSDSQSSSSVSPKAIVSPRFSGPLHVHATARTHESAVHPLYDYHGMPGQMALSPLEPVNINIPQLSRYEEVGKPLYPQIQYLRNFSRNAYEHITTSRSELMRDSRMHVSSLVQ